MPSRTACLAALSLALLFVAASAQQPALEPAAQPAPQPAPQPMRESDKPMTTLHVYTDLVQLPVLVLDGEHGRMKPIPAEKFLVSLDAGPLFHPVRVRQQGDDPIALAILLDPDSEPELMPDMSAAVSGLAPAYLHADDRVTIYTINCGLFRTLDAVPADPVVLKAAVDNALAPWFERHRKKHPAACEKQVNLWDAMTLAVKRISNSPSRRVLLAVSNGEDHGSRTAWSDLRYFAQGTGVAVFGFVAGQSVSSPVRGFADTNGRRLPSGMMLEAHAEWPFDTICQLSGGIILRANPTFEAQELNRFTTMVRERYIVEFHRPRHDEPGDHNVVVSVPKADPFAYVRPAGVAVSLPDPALAADPNTIPHDDSNDPELGHRKNLKPK